MIDVVPLDTPTLGDRSYLVHDGEVALVVDPQRDVDRMLALAAAAGVRITHVFETHVHNDYVTGGLELARATGAEYLLSAADEVAFDHRGLDDGQTVRAGSMTVRALHTPGHTFTHLSYLVEVDGRVQGVFSGGSLLYGSTGRPDLLGERAARPLAHAQYRSAHRLADAVPPDTPLYPTHGFGSFCSATQSEASSSTLSAERRSNPALTLDEDGYVEELLAGLDAYPAYYAHMAPTNSVGPAPVDLSPPRPVDAAELRRRIDAGEWVVDLRAQAAFARGHLPGTVNVGLDGSFATYLGWLIPWGTPLTLLGRTAEQVAEAQRELVRIGIDRPAGAATGRPEEWAGGAPLRSYSTADFRALAAAAATRQIVLLDVRRNDEWRQSHLRGATHVPLHELPGRIAEVPDGEVWVYCHSGYRASIAASLLDAAGRTVVAVDDDYENAEGAGLPARSAQLAGTAR
ncbi:MAG TPA: MBL fold metallo-hydrolase [Frankiaceae bacterium]|nr:MBL fold metallo-hydrolase [Frankiaceae bacterium]